MKTREKRRKQEKNGGAKMFEPCFEHCYIRFGKQYTPDCDDKCAYAKAVKERNEALEKLQRIYQKIKDENQEKTDFLNDLFGE